MILIALWHTGSDATELPSLVYWQDGSPASPRDLADARDHTTFTFSNPDGSRQQIFFPNLYANAIYSARAHSWRFRPSGLELTTDVSDPLVSHVDLIAEMATFPMVYKLNVIREMIDDL